MAIFQELNRQGKTIVLITHDEAIAAVASRVLEIVDGRIVSDRREESPRGARSELASWQGNGASAEGNPEDRVGGVEGATV